MTERQRRIESTEERLERLQRATLGVAPRADLAARLSAPYRSGPRPRRRLEALVLPWGRSAMVAAALCAAAATALAFQAERAADAALVELSLSLDLDESAGWEP